MFSCGMSDNFLNLSRWQLEGSVARESKMISEIHTSSRGYASYVQWEHLRRKGEWTREWKRKKNRNGDLELVWDENGRGSLSYVGNKV